MPLDEYQAKRDAEKTPEPFGGAPSAGALSFVVQKHHARALHYDFRLELDGVLVSWAVPKGPSLDPHDKHLAVHVEDHPIDYGGFEGTIPAGEYGAGTVIVWDRGTWEPVGDPHAGMAKGDFKFTLHGEKLRGLWVLVRLKPRPGEKRENWLLIKERDEFARPHEEYDVLAEEPESVLAGGLGTGVAGGRGTRPDSSPAPDRSEPACPPGDPCPEPASGDAGPSIPAGDSSRQPAPAPFPSRIEFQLATLVETPPAGDEWLSEVKYDGYRLAIALENGEAHAYTRSHADWTEKFAGLCSAAKGMPAASAVIDGEAIVFDEHGVSQFELLQRAFKEHPERIAYSAFDLLYLNGYDLRELPLTQRKELLRDLLDGLSAGSPIRYADHVVGDAAEFHDQACASELEGIVCKRANGRYLPGRGRDWLKVKCRLEQEFVIGGFTEGEGSRASLGSLLLGYYEGDRLVYAGRAGSGLTEAIVSDLRGRLEAMEQPDSPFEPAPTGISRTVHWTRPELLAEVWFREWTSEGVLRQPVFLGMREDKAPQEVTRERPADKPAESKNPKKPTKAKKAKSPEDEPSTNAASPTASAGSAGGHAGSSLSGAGEEEGRVRRPPQTQPTPAGPATVLGVKISNPEKLLFPDSPDFPKLALARYYEAVMPVMLPEVLDRPLTLLRCPTGHGRGCFYQRHPDLGVSAHLKRFKNAIKHEELEFLYIDSPEGLVALAQMGVGEIHTWLAHQDEPKRPDRIVFDLDPGPEVTWPEIVSAAKLVRDEVAEMGFTPFVKSTGSKGLHVVLPIEPVWDFERIRAFSKAIVDRLAARHPDRLVGKMAKDIRTKRIFFDYLRNAEGASAVAAYSTRMKSGPSCALPLAWEELADTLDIRSFTPAKVVERVSAGVNPWADIDEHAAGSRVLRRAEASLEG